MVKNKNTWCKNGSLTSLIFKTVHVVGHIKLWHNIYVPKPLWKQNKVEEVKKFKSSTLTFELLKIKIKKQFSSYFLIFKVKQEQKLFSCTFNASQNFPWKNCWHQLKGNISVSRIFQDWTNTEQTYYNDTCCFSGCCSKLKLLVFFFSS